METWRKKFVTNCAIVSVGVFIVFAGSGLLTGETLGYAVLGGVAANVLFVAPVAWDIWRRIKRDLARTEPGSTTDSGSGKRGSRG